MRRDIMNSSDMIKQLTENQIKASKSDRLVRDINHDIDSGYCIQKMDTTTNDDDIDNYAGAIILKPYYQRDYRYSIKEESSIIESMLLGIPIPPVYMVSTIINGISALDVVDGQHRLTAIYRFINKQFKLKDLSILTEYNGKFFNDLPREQQNKLREFLLSVYTFEDYPNEQVEIEIFRRYNQGTKPLTPQEIRTAVYRSPISDFLNSFINNIKKSSEDKNKRLCLAYNVTDDRLVKKKVHESMFTILYIIEYGYNEKFKDSTMYSEQYMKQKFKVFSDENISKEKKNDILKNTIKLFEKFNDWILYLSDKKTYPFSKELYGVSSRNYKFQMSIAMLLAGIFSKYHENIDTLYDESFFNYMIEKLRDSYLEDPHYNASSTNSNALINFLNDFNYEI